MKLKGFALTLQMGLMLAMVTVILVGGMSVACVDWYRNYQSDALRDKCNQLDYAVRRYGQTHEIVVTTSESYGADGALHYNLVESSNTNLIVTTDHHSYQLLLQTADWYNPMVVWSYDIEDSQEMQNILDRDARSVTSGLAVSDPDQLNFDYEIKGSGEFYPTMVFDDGKKMFIKFKKLSGRLPVLFGRERGKKMLTMLNYSIKDNCYIVDRVCDEAELRVNDSESDKIRIKRKK